MMHREIMIVRSAAAPTVEIDTSASAVYVRFSSEKVCKTVPIEKPGVIVTIDLDADGEVIGIELIGVKEFGIQKLMQQAPVKAPNINFDRTRYVRAASRSLVNV